MSRRGLALPEEEVQQRRDLTRLRFECAQTAVAEKQRLIALRDLVFPEYAAHFSDLFGAASRQFLAQFPTAAHLAQVDIRRLPSPPLLYLLYQLTETGVSKI